MKSHNYGENAMSNDWQSMTKFSLKYPVFFSLIVVAIYDPGLTTLLRMIFHRDRLQLPTLLISQLVLVLYVASLLLLLRWWREGGFTFRLSRRSLIAYLPWLLLPVLVIADSAQVTADPGRILGFVLFALLVGFAEEGLVRGVVLRALLPGGAMRAALLSALIFGVAHLTNALQGKELAPTIVQAIYATFIGIGFAGCRLYTGTIWPAIVVHGLIDFTDFASRDFSLNVEPQTFTPSQAIVPIVLTGLYALYGLWLIRLYRRRSGQAEMSSP